VATQNPTRARALVVPDKAERVYRFHQSTLHALQELVQAAGLPHTSALRPHHIVRRINDHEIQLMSNVLKYLQPNDLLEGNYRYRVYEKFWPIARAESFHPEL